MNKEFIRMQELAGVSLNEATQIEADVEKWLEGYLKGTVLTSNNDFEKYGSQDDPKKIKYVVDGGFKKGGFLDVKYSYNKEFIAIPQKDILDLAKKMGVEDSDSYKVENAVKNALNKKGFKQPLDFSMVGKGTGEMMSQFFRDPNLKQPLDENFVGTQMVGNIFDREKEKYEDAFEHFLSERYEDKKVETQLEDLEETLKGIDEDLMQTSDDLKKVDATSLKAIMLRLISGNSREEFKKKIEELIDEMDDDSFGS